MDSEMSSCCCFLLRLLFVQKTAHARGGCQGAPGFVHRYLFALGRHPFFEANLGTLFFTKKCNFEGKLLPKWTQNEVFWKLFLENMRKRKSAFRLRRRVRIAYEPLLWSAQGDSKIEEKKEPISEPLFLVKNVKNTKKELQKVSKWVTVFRGWRLFGGSWATFGAPSRFGPQKWAHSAPKVLPGTENYLQNDPKSVKNDPESASESEFIGDS